MSDKSGGFFSSMGRFFSGGSATKSKEIEKTSEVSSEDSSTLPSSSESATAAPTSFLRDIVSIDSGSAVESDDLVDNTPRVSASARIGSSLRYLSPSALDQRNGLEIDVDPVPDIFFTTPSASTNRKRQLTELDKQALPQSFRSESVKRSRFLNRSLLEPTLKNSLGSDKRLDMTWCGELTSNHSPASSITNFSLLSKRSGATTNGSLSTRTQEIYKKLEGASTPAKEIQRMSMMRAGLSRPEKWGNLESASDTPPPLKKAGDGIPSRIQLISKAMAQPRQNPYWRDLTRKRGESKNGDTSSSDTHSLKSLNGNFAAAELSSLFSLDAPAPKKSATTTSEPAKSSSIAPKKPHVSILKGPDGKAVSRNTFKLDDEDSEESQPPPLPAATLSNPQPLMLAPGSSAPQRGFLDNLQFTFSAPVDSGVSVSKTAASSDSDSCEETAEKASSESSSSSSSEDSELSEESGDEVEEVKESRPHTSADTISTANGSNQSSTDSSPKVTEVPKPTVPVAAAPAPAPPAPKPAAAAQWECQACFTNWPATNDKCGCCGTPKEGASSEASKPAEKQLVSNLSAFAPTKPASGGGFSFGFGGSSTPAASGSSAPSAPSAFGTSSSTSLFGASKPAPAPVVPAPIAPTPVVSAPAPAPAAASSDRVAWECPDCFVSNQATHDKCPCCSHVKYPSAAGSSSSNVFGARAFNPTASTGPAVTFGVDSSAAPKPAFGFGASKTSDAPPAAAPAPAFGFSAPAAPAPVAVAPVAPAAPVAAPTSSNLLQVPKLTPVGSLFGNLPKPADPVKPIVTPATSTIPMFGGSGSTSLFGGSSQPAPAAPKPTEEALKPSIFGSSAAPPSLTSSGSLFSGSSASSTTSSIPPFGGSLFGGSAPKPAVEAPKVTPALSFGPTSTTEAPKPFGSTPAPTTSNSLFGAGSSTSLFGKPADSTTSAIAPSLFGGSSLKKPFGEDIGTTTSDGAPAKRGMFSLDPPSTTNTIAAAPKLAFGGNLPTFGTTPAPTSTGSSLFSSVSTGMFGGPATTSTSTFGPTSTIGFGGAPAAAPVFGGFGKQPVMSTSSSTNSLFGQAAAAPDSSNPFASSVTSSSANTNGGFNFSSSSSTASTSSNNGGVFQFGGAAPAPSTASAGQPFQFGGLQPPAPAAPGSMDNNAFAYQAPTGGGARKMAMARRRNIRK